MRGQVAEQDVPHLKVGQEAQVGFDGVARSFNGTIWQIGAIIDSTTRQAPCASHYRLPIRICGGCLRAREIQVGSSLG